MRAALVALAALIPVGAGCHSAATGVLVDVTGAVTADQLRVTATVDGAALPATLVPATPHPLALPTSFFAELPDRARTASFIIDSIPQVAVIHPYLITHDWAAFADLFRDPVAWTGIVHGLWLALAYTVIFLLAAWARFSSKDVTS